MLTISGNSRAAIERIKKKLHKYQDDVRESCKVFIHETEREARRKLMYGRSPEKYGLAQSFTKKIGKNTFELSVNKHYAAFVEFGTKAKFSLADPRLQAIASEFKGYPMDFDDLIERIQRTTGRNEKRAYLTAKAIAQKGSSPRPFFYNSAFEQMDRLKKRVTNIIK